MAFAIELKADINVGAIASNTMPDAFWLASLNEWHKLYYQYVPKVTGNLAGSITPDPKARTITHTVPYARRQYYGGGFDFYKEENRLASARWDQAAIPQQKDKLVRFMQGALNSGRFKTR